MVIDAIVAVLFAIGVAFFAAGSIALLRFPDLHSRLHALTKADNLGLGCIALGAAVESSDLLTGLKIMLVWVIVLAGSSVVSFLIGQRFPRRSAREHEELYQ